MKRIIGNFLTQPNQDFPMDCETLDNVQVNESIVSVLGHIAGDKTIILGCELTQGDTQRKPGYVFLKTKAYPEGEVIYWEGGVLSAGMYVKEEFVSVSDEGYVYPQAYTVRSLAPGIGSENYKWSDFKEIKTLIQLEKMCQSLQETIDLMAPAPLGIVEVWAGKTVPAGYALCDGSQFRIEDYPGLYAAIGDTFNKAVNHAGDSQTTSPGYFRLPDLRGRFIVGESSVDNEYKVKGSAGGEKKHQLTIEEMPAHSHDYATWETGNSDNNRFSGNKNNDRPDKETHATSSSGGNLAHENRPPYYVLAYIMRLK